MKHAGYTVATQQDVRDLIDKLRATEVERDAASAGVREALSVIEKAAAILDGEKLWRAMTRLELVDLLGRGLTFLDNAPEMIRACVVGSIPRDETAAGPEVEAKSPAASPKPSTAPTLTSSLPFTPGARDAR